MPGRCPRKSRGARALGPRPAFARARAGVSVHTPDHQLLTAPPHRAGAPGSMEADFGQAEGELLVLPDVGGFEALLALAQTAPDLLRFGFTPLYLSYQDVWDAAYTVADVVHSGCWADPRYAVRAAVT